MAPPTPRRPLGQGQWALGHREPLNANEQFKKDDDGLNVRRRIEEIHAPNGFASIDPTDLNATPELFRRWPDAAALAAAPVSEIEEVIRSTGFFRNKARSP